MYSACQFCFWWLWEYEYFILWTSSNRKYDPFAIVQGWAIKQWCALSVFLYAYSLQVIKSLAIQVQLYVSVSIAIACNFNLIGFSKQTGLSYYEINGFERNFCHLKGHIPLRMKECVAVEYLLLGKGEHNMSSCITIFILKQSPTGWPMSLPACWITCLDVMYCAVTKLPQTIIDCHYIGLYPCACILYENDS